MKELVTTLRHPSGTAEVSRQLLSFRLGQQYYAVDINGVREIRGWSTPSVLPGLPAYVCGVLDLRGSVVPVIDLRKRFHMPSAEPTRQSVIVVVQVHARTVGLLVDSVSDVQQVNKSQIQPPPAFKTAVQGHLVEGVVSQEAGLLVLLNLPNILAEDDLNNMQDALESVDDASAVPKAQA